MSEKNIVINEGLTFKAGLRIMNYTGKVDARISTGEVFLNVSLPAIDWLDGAIQIRRNKEDKVNGPIFYMNINYDAQQFYIEGMYCEQRTAVRKVYSYMKFAGYPRNVLPC